MSHKLVLFVGIATLSAATAAHAGARDRYDQDRAWGVIQAERDRQQAIVEQGRADGSITFLEKYAIERGQARIGTLAREALADGRLSREEFLRIREAQADAARHIHAESHDGQVRGWWWRLWR